jgi:putative ABC transport system substrate-binding protein
MPAWRRLLFCVALLASAWVQAEPASSGSVSAGRTAKLLILDSQLGNPYDEVRAALLKRLEQHGYIANKNLHLSLRVAGNDIKEGERILREEAGKGWNAVFVGGTIATIAAKNTLLGRQDLPVVFGSPTDPVGIGVISDFSSKPTQNFTGVCYPVPITARLRFIRQLMPGARTLGLIYADMPQSVSYNQWLRDALAKEPEFKDLQILFRPIPLITGEQGDLKMAAMAKDIIKELDPQVDAFIKPNDQMGTRRPFAEVVFANATKPLFGIVRDDVMGGWGATAVVYPSHESIGEQSADMLKVLFEGGKPTDLAPQWPKKYGFAVDLNKTRRFDIRVPVEVLRLAGPNIVK